MTYYIKCPACGEDGLDPRYSPSECKYCDKKFRIVGYCPKCHEQMNKLQACSIDFFCDTCNELVSKKKINFKVSAIDNELDEE